MAQCAQVSHGRAYWEAELSPAALALLGWLTRLAHLQIEALWGNALHSAVCDEREHAAIRDRHQLAHPQSVSALASMAIRTYSAPFTHCAVGPNQ